MNTVEFAGLVVAETTKAVCIMTGGEHEVWIPRAHLADDPPPVGEMGTFEVPTWFADQEDIVESSLAELRALRDAAASIKAVTHMARPVMGRCRHDTFGEGDVLELKGDKIVARFPTFGVRTLLRTRVKIST